MKRTFAGMVAALAIGISQSRAQNPSAISANSPQPGTIIFPFLFIFLLTGFPIALSLAIATVIYLYYGTNIPLVIQIGKATFQVVSVGDRTQRDRARALLADTRRGLYRILADDTHDAETDE